MTRGAMQQIASILTHVDVVVAHVEDIIIE